MQLSCTVIVLLLSLFVFPHMETSVSEVRIILPDPEIVSIEDTLIEYFALM